MVEQFNGNTLQGAQFLIGLREQEVYIIAEYLMLQQVSFQNSRCLQYKSKVGNHSYGNSAIGTLGNGG